MSSSSQSPLVDALDTDQQLTAILQTSQLTDKDQGEKNGKKEETMRCLSHPGQVQAGVRFLPPSRVPITMHMFTNAYIAKS